MDLKHFGVLVLRILEHVPEPHVQEAALAIDAVIDAVHQARVDDVPVADLHEAAAAAIEPWQRIHDRATRPLTAQELGTFTGSTGE